MKEDFAQTRRIILQRMAEAARRSGRAPEEVRLVAVSKTVATDRIAAAAATGQDIFGENYLQEAADKIERLGHTMRWHFIGHLQSNKARLAAQLFDMIETVDRLKIARKLDEALQELGRRMDVLVQVNIGAEASKSGVSIAETEALLEELRQFGRLRVLGLMILPPFFDAPEKVRPYFRELRLLAEKCSRRGLFYHNRRFELSMGMSGDFEAAIEEGATLVRVGTALFGSR